MKSTEMKVYNFVFVQLFLTLSYILTCNGVEEIVDHGSVNEHSSLVLDIIKRLGEPNYRYQSEDQEGELVRPGLAGKLSGSGSNELQSVQTVCDHTVEKGTIIQTTESINAGAVYINSVKFVKSNADCLEYCCQNTTCDVAVYQDKGERYCYLFRCAGQCIFKSHSGYFVNTIKVRKSTEHPEEDLQSLHEEPTVSEGGRKKPMPDTVHKPADSQQVIYPAVESTTVKKVTTTENEIPELVIVPHSVGLSGFCTQSVQCEDPNAVCGHGNCVCKDTFYAKDGMCRKVCFQSEFECYELGTLERGPECILKSLVCDSYLNCADGSDEFNCASSAQNNKQMNRSQQSEPALSSVKGTAKSENLAGSYSQSVGQEPATENNQKQIAPQQAQQMFNTKQHEAGYKSDNMAPLQNYDVRLKPTIANKDGNMHANQNLYTNEIQPNAPQPNQYPDIVGNPTHNIDPIPAQATNINTNQGNKGLLNNNPLNMPTISKNSDSSPTNDVNLDSKTFSDNSAQLSSPIKAQQNQVLEHTNNGLNTQKNFNQQPTIQSSVDARHGQNRQYSSLESHNVKSHQPSQIPHSSNQENDMRTNSNLHADTSVNKSPQSSLHSDKLLPQKPSPLSSMKLPKPTHSHSQISDGGSSKSRTRIQSSSKSHSSPFDPSESQNHLSLPSYSNSQKWLDPSNLYVPYNIGESQSQQDQTQVGNHYFDSSQYYPPYSSDSLDPLPESLLENTGSNDEFSQFGGPSIGRGKSLGLIYNNQNLGYQGYPDSQYGGQYVPSSRYEDNGDYRSPVYQDTDMYSLGSQRGYRPSPGLFEDFPTGLRPPKLNTVHRVQDSELPSVDQKQTKEDTAVHEQNTQAAKSDPHTTRSPVDSGLIKNKTDKSASPLQSTHTPFPESHSEKKHIFLSSEKFIIANTSDAEGPIIALSLGLAFTIILLVLVGCRLRNVRHRLRKGRPLHQNEADYLINGMYL